MATAKKTPSKSSGGSSYSCSPFGDGCAPVILLIIGVVVFISIKYL